jgi:PAS domain S-box-containing protein
MQAAVTRNPGHKAHFALAQQALGFVTWIWKDSQGDRAEYLGDISPLLGLPANSFSGRYGDYQKCLHPEDVLASRRTLKECVEGSRPEYRTEERVVWPDGTVRWLETYGRATYGSDGRAVQLMGMVRDVTDRKRLEDERVRSESEFRAVFETSPEPMSITRLRDSRLMAMNDACVQQTGHPRSAVGRPTRELGLWADLEERERMLAVLRVNRRIGNHAMQMKKADGSRADVLLSASVIDFEGEECAVWSWRDVTAIRRAERALADSELRYRSLFDSALNTLLVFAPDGRLIDTNAAGCSCLGLSRERMLGMSVHELLGSGVLDRVLPQMSNIQNRRSVLTECTLRGAGGEARHVEIAAGSLPDGNVLAIVRDVSERKRSQAALAELNASLEQRVQERTAELNAANRELESFSHSVSHDLRAPLFHISGFATLLRKDRASALSPDALGFLERIEQGADHMGRLLEGLLEFSRAGRIALRSDAVDMQSLIGEVLTMLRGPETARAEIHVAELPQVRGDAMLLRQVWQNLVGNALKFSRHAEAPRIQIGARWLDDAIEFHVRDNGAGFAMRHAEKLFEVFERLHSQDEFEGTGAGLSIVKRIVERHGGRVRAHSEPGNGAEFRFTLPL